MKRFEYKVLTISAQLPVVNYPVDLLNELGLDGWLVTAAVYTERRELAGIRYEGGPQAQATIEWKYLNEYTLFLARELPDAT